MILPFYSFDPNILDGQFIPNNSNKLYILQHTNITLVRSARSHSSVGSYTEDPRTPDEIRGQA
jgi:hypothetical protein